MEVVQNIDMGQDKCTAKSWHRDVKRIQRNLRKEGGLKIKRGG